MRLAELTPMIKGDVELEISGVTVMIFGDDLNDKLGWHILCKEIESVSASSEFSNCVHVKLKGEK